MYYIMYKKNPRARRNYANFTINTLNKKILQITL